MRKALVLAALLARPGFSAEFQGPRPIEAARQALTAQIQPLVLPGLPAALAAALPAVPVETVKAPPQVNVYAALAQTGAAIDRSAAAAPAATAQLYDGIGARLASAYAGSWSEPLRVPTAAEARKLVIMKRMADAFLVRKGIWFPHKMERATPANPGGFRGIMVADLKSSFGKYGDGVVVVDARSLGKVLPARLADVMLHELVHHLSPLLGGDEMLTHMLEAEFSGFVKAWLKQAGLGYDLKPLTLVSRLRDAWRWGETFYRIGQRSLSASYAAGRLVDMIVGNYGRKTWWKENPLGFPSGVAGAFRQRARLLGGIAKAEAELAAAGSDPVELERWTRVLRNHRRTLDAYDRLVIPTLARYERISGWKPAQ